MRVNIEEIGSGGLSRYARIPIAFEVKSVLRVRPVDGGLGGFLLEEQPVSPPYVKDYDAQDEGGRPERWAKRFDLSRWGVFVAQADGKDVGGAVVAYDTPGVHMLEGRTDLAVLWDMRVHPDMRGEGIGSQLFRHAAAWAQARGCHTLKAETQNVNVPACRFYARQGCELGAIHRYAYRGEPGSEGEVMLLWYLELA